MRRRSRIRRVLKGIAITTLSLAALLSLIWMIVGYTQALLRPPLNPRASVEIDFGKFRGPVWENARYSLYVSARYGHIDFTRYSKQCLSCEMYPPNHTATCFYKRFNFSYHWYSRVDKRVWLPGLEWTTGVVVDTAFTKFRISFWLLFIVFAAYPTVWFIRGPLRRHRRRKRGACLNCGYNLTGNVSGVCPECGEAV